MEELLIPNVKFKCLYSGNIYTLLSINNNTLTFKVERFFDSPELVNVKEFSDMSDIHVTDKNSVMLSINQYYWVLMGDQNHENDTTTLKPDTRFILKNSETEFTVVSLPKMDGTLIYKVKYQLKDYGDKWFMGLIKGEWLHDKIVRKGCQIVYLPKKKYCSDC